MGKRTWTDEDIILLGEMNKAHVPLAEMAKRLGRSCGALSNFRSKYGITYPPVISKEDMKKAVELRRKGYTCSEIARKFNVSPDFMLDHLKNIVPAYSGRVWNLERLGELENAVMECDTLQEVSDRINKTLESVKQICFVQYGTIKMDKLRQTVQEYTTNDNIV